jgi:hypothetical protein
MPRVSAIVFTACRPHGRGRAQQPFFWLRQVQLFWLRQVQRVAQDLVFEGFLAEQPLQFAHLVLQCSIFGGGHHFLAGRDSRERALGVEPPPREHLVRRDPVLPCHQRHRHPRRVCLLNDPRLLFRRPAPSPLNRRDDLNPIDVPSHRHRHTPGS